jgi:hypothetical protein
MYFEVFLLRIEIDKRHVLHAWKACVVWMVVKEDPNMPRVRLTDDTLPVKLVSLTNVERDFSPLSI